MSSSHQLTPIEELCAIAKQLTGVQLDNRHSDMIKSRLQPRLGELGFEELGAYLKYYHDNELAENPRLISLLTTHHTYFFREMVHFNFLLSHALPALLPLVRARKDHSLRIWSAACSRGQESYSLAMFCDLHVKRLDPACKVTIVGTDVDEQSVAVARNGVYLQRDLKEVPMPLLQNHWIRGTEEISDYVKAKKSLRDYCTFAQQNLLSMGSRTSAEADKFDIIFCRNVFIYFKEDQIRTIVNGLMQRLRPGGYLIVGISESLSQMKLPLQRVGPSIYQNIAAEAAAPVAAIPMASALRPAAEVAAAADKAAAAVRLSTGETAPLRVLCVDDSASILTLLKQILGREHGFEIVGVAKNGVEAAVKVAELKPAVLTLDIHMPEMTGIEYLQKYFRAGHPPVIMVTSVSRENAELAGQALSLGACDYVEKPALSNLADRADEIRTKLRCAVLAQALSLSPSLAFDRTIQSRSGSFNTQKCLRVVVFQLSQRSRLKALFHELSEVQPPCLLLLDGAKDALGAVATLLSEETGRKVEHLERVPDVLEDDAVYLLDLLGQGDEVVKKFAATRRCSVLVYGEVSKKSADRMAALHNPHLVLQDLGGGRATEHLRHLAADIVLPTSFAYLSDAFFRKGP